MKVDDISGRPQIDPLRESARRGRTDHKDAFELLLEQELGIADKLSEASETALENEGLSEMPGVVASKALSSISSVASPPPGMLTSTETLLSRIESLINGAEGNPRKMEGVIQSLATEAESLKSEMATLPESHPLKTVGSEIEVLAYVESVKWNRGDYL